MVDPPQVGQDVLVQEVWNGRVWSARPMRVVGADDDVLALWMPQGTPWRAPDAPVGTHAMSRAEAIAWCLQNNSWDYLDRVWKMSTLWVIPRGSYHATWWCWSGEDLLGWYVNFQWPLRVGAGRRLQYMDMMVDARVGPDRTWTWKDKDDLALMVNRGIFDAEDAERPFREAPGLQADASRGRGDFDPRWTRLRPVAPVEPPRLPEWWRQP